MIKTRCTSASKSDCENMYMGFLSFQSNIQHCVSFVGTHLPVASSGFLQEVAMPFMKWDRKCPVAISGRVPQPPMRHSDASRTRPAVGRRSTYTPSVPMSLQILVADFAVAKKSLKGNFHFPFGGQQTSPNSC